MPPQFKQVVPMATKTHGWICFSNDGGYALRDTGEVFDAKTKQRVAQWTDRANAEGSPVMSSEFFDVHGRGGDVDFLGHQMGICYVRAE